MPPDGRSLRLRFHGRVLEHLGLQTYQSPVAAVAELVANAWDADSETVRITLPRAGAGNDTLVVADDGHGMSFDECQNCFLEVGRNRRGANPAAVSRTKGRAVLGRKGIGKFAGFGIARVVTIETITEATGERTVFRLALDSLVGDTYVGGEKDVQVVEYEAPSAERRVRHGTTITLSDLTFERRPGSEAFSKSMARRFLLHEQQVGFRVLVDGNALPNSLDLAGIEYSFPRDYTGVEQPPTLTAVDAQGWGTERLPDGTEIQWRILFHQVPIDEEGLKGVAIFAHGKLAQAPFFFNLSGGLGGQHGAEYMTGQVRCDFIDGLASDLISTERQRVNWEHRETLPLLEWGQERVRALLRLWRDKRGAKRSQALEAKVAAFSARLEKLPTHERRTVRRALQKLASVSSLSTEEFDQLGLAILAAWEAGRLKELIDRMADLEEMSAEELLGVLMEAHVLTALNVAEAVKTKLRIVRGLRDRIRNRDIEAAVRDYIAEHPYLVHPSLETFRVERGVRGLLSDAAEEAGLHREEYRGRVDLALAGGPTLFVLEFMRPGLVLDWDHVQRCEHYVRILRERIAANTGGRFSEVRGLIVADSIERRAAIRNKIESLEGDGILAVDWETLLDRAESQWREFLDVEVGRAPGDERLMGLASDEPAEELVDGGEEPGADAVAPTG